MTVSWKSPVFALLLFLTLIIQSGCGLFPENVSLSDPQVQPLLKAMQQVDRASLGFTPVTTNSTIKLERRSSGGSYDVMLHVDGATSRTIAFRKTESGYRWIAEQESFQGPKWWRTVDGNFRESIEIDYQIERVEGIPTNNIFIRYYGEDINIAGQTLTLAEVRPIIEKWKTLSVEPEPPRLPESDFPDPLPFAILLVALSVLTILCCLALVVAANLVGVATFLLLTGIVSTALLVGALRKSVSAALRAIFIQLGAVLGVLIGAIATCAVTFFSKSAWNLPLHWLLGISIGCASGIVCAWLFNQVWSYLAKRLMTRLVNRGN